MHEHLGNDVDITCMHDGSITFSPNLVKDSKCSAAHVDPLHVVRRLPLFHPNSPLILHLNSHCYGMLACLWEQVLK